AGAALHHLEATRREFRGWEYRHLRTLFTSNQRVFQGHPSGVLDVCFSPDGKRLATAGVSRAARLLDAETVQQVRLCPGGALGSSVCFSPDGKRLAIACQVDAPGEAGWVKLWDVVTGQEVLTLKGLSNQFVGVSFSPDGKRLASACPGARPNDP